MDVEDYHPVRLVDRFIDWELWEYVLDQYGAPFARYCIKVFYGIYTHLTFFNMVVFFVKCVPTGVLMYRLIKSASSRERMKLKQIELDELQLQFQIVNAKLSVREAEFAEREELLRRRVENLCRVRKRIREIIADDDELRNAVNGNALWDEYNFSNSNNTSEEASSENKLFVDLLREMQKYDEVITRTQLDPEMLSCGEPSYERATTENSVYSSAANGGTKQDIHVKIVKVTNVYRVAYLRQLIKQKRLRRANRQALLRKKMDSINHLLEDWQNTLSTVINSTPCLLNNSPQVDLASQEARGDCSKPNLYNFSDSDSDFINSSDNFHDNYTVSWTRNLYTPINAYNNYCDEYNGDAAITRDYNDDDIRDYDRYTCQEDQHENHRSAVLDIVPEETTSQLEIKEIATDAE